jgi:tetratricopeptide (TPR) repeat protein
LFKKALKLAPTNPNGALPLLEEAHKLNPADNDVLGAAGYVSHNAEDFTMSWRFLTELGRHVPLTAPELLILGNSLYKTEQYDRAIETLQKIPEEFDQYTKAVLLLGGCFAAKGDHEAAAEMLEKGAQHMLGMNDDLKELHYQLGLVYEHRGDYEAAKKEFKRVYLADVNYRDVKERIGREKAGTSPAPEPGDVTEQIRKLAVLKEEGLLTEEEYEAKKADLLARI